MAKKKETEPVKVEIKTAGKLAKGTKSNDEDVDIPVSIGGKTIITTVDVEAPQKMEANPEIIIRDKAWRIKNGIQEG